MSDPIAYLQIVNWDKLQHYSKRTPPWIKLHRDLLRDYKFAAMPDVQQLQIIQLWLLASQLDNKIPDDPHFISKQLPCRADIDIEALIIAGFIERKHNDSNVIASCEQDATPETEAEAETETEAEAENTLSVEDFGNYWNSKKTLPNIRAFTAARKKAFSIRIAESDFAGHWQEIIDKLAASDFCTGKNDRDWSASVDWILKNSTNYVKVLESKYDNQKFINGNLNVNRLDSQIGEVVVVA